MLDFSALLSNLAFSYRMILDGFEITIVQLSTLGLPVDSRNVSKIGIGVPRKNVHHKNFVALNTCLELID